MRPTATYVARSVICVCLDCACVGQWAQDWAVQNRLNWSKCRLEGWLCRSKESVLDGGPDAPIQMSAYYIALALQWSTLPAAAGECACQTQTANECIVHREAGEALRDSGADFCQITLDIIETCYALSGWKLTFTSHAIRYDTIYVRSKDDDMASLL